MSYPKMVRIRQLFDVPPPVKDIPQAVRHALRPLRPALKIMPKETVAITAGSRGVANIVVIVKTLVEELKAMGALPFIVPAMGSHGGATAEGQVDVLRHLGITEDSMGVPIRSSMEVVQIGETLGFPIYLDKVAFEADHIAVVARIKPHTDFKGDIESGFYKMMAIGLGKHKGAAICHRAFLRARLCQNHQARGMRDLEEGKNRLGPGHHRERVRPDDENRGGSPGRDGEERDGTPAHGEVLDDEAPP